MILLGCIFMLCFTSFSVIQAYAGKFFGESAGADATCAVYLSFTFGCFFSPSVVVLFGPRASLALGISGYVLFVLAGLVVLMHDSDAASTYYVELRSTTSTRATTDHDTNNCKILTIHFNFSTWVQYSKVSKIL